MGDDLVKRLRGIDRTDIYLYETMNDAADRIEALTAENASLKHRVAELEALLYAVTAYHNGKPSNPPHTGRAKTKLGEME